MRLAVPFVVLAFLALLLQTAVLPHLASAWGAPDLLLVMAAYFGLRLRTASACLGAFLLGYLQDAVSGTVLGLHAFSLTLVFLVVRGLSGRLWVDHPLSNMAVVFLAAVIKSLVVMTLVAVFLTGEEAWGVFLPRLSFEATAAALLSLPVFGVLGRMQDLLAPVEE